MIRNEFRFSGDNLYVLDDVITGKVSLFNLDLPPQVPTDKFRQTVTAVWGGRESQHIFAVKSGDCLSESSTRCPVAFINDQMAYVSPDFLGNRVNTVYNCNSDLGADGMFTVPNLSDL